jgi:hypothetical protein
VPHSALDARLVDGVELDDSGLLAHVLIS